MSCASKVKNSNNFKGEKVLVKLPALKRMLLYSLLFTFLLLGVSMASAGFRVRGDFPDTGLNYRIEAYSTAQTNMCDGSADSGTLYFSSTYTTGDSFYDDDDDFDETYSGSLGGATTVYFYFCGPGGNAAAKVVEFTKTVSDGDDLEIDLGYVNGTANVHDDLASHYVVVCDAYDGSLVSSVTKQTDGTTAEYTQYYYIDRGDISSSSDDPVKYYVFLDSDSADCTWDSTKITGKALYLDSSQPDNYGVYATFEPDTKVSGDAHADLADANIALMNSSGYIVGIARIRNAADGGTGDDDYNIYYDNPTDGDLSLTIEPDGNPVSSAHITTVSGIDRTTFASGGYDFIIDVEDAGDGVPTDISEVRVSMTIGTDAVVFSTTPVQSGSVKYYDLFVDDAGDGSDDIEFYAYGSKVLTVTRDLDSTSPADVAIDVGKVSGEAHSGLESGDDTIEVYNDSTCSTKVSSETVNPSDDTAGVDYNQYFVEDGSGTFYLKATRDSTYSTCGNAFTLTDQTGTVNLTTEVYGLVPSPIDEVIADLDKDGSYNNLDAYTAPSSGVYYLYTISDSDASVYFEANDVKELARAKDLSADINVHVAKVSGNTHSAANDGGGETVDVFSDSKCSTTQLSSETETPLLASDPDYTQYYESSGSGDYYIKLNVDISGTKYASCVRFSGSGNGQADTVDILIEMTGEIPTGVSAVAVDLDQDGTYDAYTASTSGSSPNITYYLYTVTDSDSTADANFLDASDNVLLSRNAVLDANETLDVARIIGDVHSNLQDGTDRLEICSSITCATLYSSETVNPSAGAGDNDDFAVYYEVAHTGSSDIMLHIFDDDTTDYSAFVDVDVANGANVLPGDTDIIDLTQLFSGTTVSEIDWIWADSDGSEEGAWEFAADTNGTTYRLSLIHI